MIVLLLTAVALQWQTTISFEPPAWQQEVGRRFAKAIKGEVPYDDADFLRPISARSSQALAPLQRCRAGKMNTPMVMSADGKHTPLTDQMTVTFDCRVKRRDGSVGITFHFSGTKVSRIETHNFDWIRSK